MPHLYMYSGKSYLNNGVFVTSVEPRSAISSNMRPVIIVINKQGLYRREASPLVVLLSDNYIITLVLLTHANVGHGVVTSTSIRTPRG